MLILKCSHCDFYLFPTRPSFEIFRCSNCMHSQLVLKRKGKHRILDLHLVDRYVLGILMIGFVAAIPFPQISPDAIKAIFVLMAICAFMILAGEGYLQLVSGVGRDGHMMKNTMDDRLPSYLRIMLGIFALLGPLPLILAWS
ncbi:MAG: hypothetical protein HC843_04580 [Sphingomonadales bacterium]|nr:hypothetical protein [Sphingomonadales bacterium]